MRDATAPCWSSLEGSAVLERVLPHLPLPDVLHARATCKAWWVRRCVPLLPTAVRKPSCCQRACAALSHHNRNAAAQQAGHTLHLSFPFKASKLEALSKLPLRFTQVGSWRGLS